MPWSDWSDENWSGELMCYLLGSEVYGETVTFRLAPGSCTDMSGAIRLARSLNPEVRSIDTISPGHPDRNTRYTFDGADWIATR